jgi:acyl carrier protein
VLSNEDVIEQIAVLARSISGLALSPDVQISAKTKIIEDLKLDSLTTMDFILALETKFDTIIPIDSMGEVETVGELAGLLRSSYNGTAH